MTSPIVTLKTEKRKGKKLPVVHILMPDGRVTEFKSLAVVVPENSDPDGELDVFCILVNRGGLPYVTPTGEIAVIPCPPFALALSPDPDKLRSLKDIAAAANLSLSTVKRAVASGDLKGKYNISERRVAIRAADVDAWLATKKV